MAKKKLSRKIKLSQRTKDAIKGNFDSVPFDKLSAEEKRYYNLVKAGKARAATGLKIKGKYLPIWLAENFKKVADKRGMTVKEYIEKNRADVEKFVKEGFTVSPPKPHEVVIEVLEKKRSVEVDTGNGIVKVSNIKAIEMVQQLAQHAYSTTNIVVLLLRMTMYISGRLQISCPEYNDYSNLIGEDFTDYLSNFEPEIQFIESDRKGNE